MEAGADIEQRRIGRDRSDLTPLALAIKESHLPVTEYLLDRGAKVSNVPISTTVPWLVEQIVAKRREVVRSILVLTGILRRRVNIPSPATAHIGGRVPLDIVRLIASHVWSTRRDPLWFQLPRPRNVFQPPPAVPAETETSSDKKCLIC